MSREAMQMALEALEDSHQNINPERGYADELEKQIEDAIKALRQALETEQETAVSHGATTVLRQPQEPVAWISDSPTKGNGKQLHWTKSEAWRWSSNITPLYTAPPKKQWVGLTEEEIDALSQARSLTDELMDCVDRLGSEADTVDPRVWQHLLVYAPKPEHEPVAWMFVNEDGECEQIEYGPVFDDPGVTPLYTSPPKREWVGLTDEERHSIREWQEIQKELGPVWAPMMLYLYLAVEAKLKEKNT